MSLPFRVCGTAFALALAACNSSTVPTSSAKADAPLGPALNFEPAAKVLPANGYGYEPTIIADARGNLWHTSHKEDWQLLLAPDSGSPTQTRSMSWARVSFDGGKTWVEPPGMTELAVQNHQLGVEGDMAMDDAGHLYFVDMYLADSTLTRWSASGPGQVTFDFSVPLLPSLQMLDDRPWITAHGDGHVFYVGNTLSGTHPLSNNNTDPFSSGSQTVYASLDGGRTFEPRGYTLSGSSGCRPASGRVLDSHLVYLFCDGGDDTLVAFVSADEGRSFERHKVDTYSRPSNGGVGLSRGDPGNPQLQVGADGTLYGFHLSPQGAPPGLDVTWTLYTSKDAGKTWSKQVITPAAGSYIYPWLSVSADGQWLGLGVYGKLKDGTQPWRFYATAWRPGTQPMLSVVDDGDLADAVDPAYPNGGDYSGSSFDPDGRLNVMWQRAVPLLPESTEIHFTRTLEPVR